MDTIIHLKPSDIISESMDTINYNFDVLANQYDIYDYRLSQLMKELEGKINNNKTLTDEQIAILTNTVDQIDTTGGGEIITSDDVQTLVDNAIRNANEAVSDMIRVTAGEQIRAALGGYAKTSEIKDKYVASTAFTSYTANADAREATVNMFAANSVFYKDQNGYLYDNDNTRLNYTNVKDLFNNGLSSSDKAKIDPEGKGLSDPDVVKRFIEYCEKHLKTVTTEVAGITAHTEEGSANVDIIASVVNDPNDTAGGNLTAAIFVRANRDDGSSIVLNADKLNFNGKKISLTGPSTDSDPFKFELSNNSDGNDPKLEINTSNFKLDNSGNVTVKGAITATSLTIESNSSAANTLKSFIEDVGNDKGWGSGGNSESYDDDWLMGAFSKTQVTGGILLAGNLLVGNSEGDVTAGMLGASTSSNDLRFFAGSDFSNRLSASFRVYEDGALYADNAHISGDVTAKRFLTTNTQSISVRDNNNTYAGNLTKSTKIESDDFIISSIGTLSNSSNASDKKNINASLTIEIQDILENPNEEINGGKAFFGIPVLCMKYLDENGDEQKYTISPMAWMLTNGQSDNSNMRWIQRYTILNSYSLKTISSSLSNKYVSGTTSINNGTATYYIFSPTNKSDFILGGNGTDAMYQLVIYGEVNNTQQNLLQTNGLATYNSNGTITNNVNYRYVGAYAYGSKIDDVYKNYISGTETHITSGNCDLFKSYTMSTISGGVSESIGSRITNLTTNGYDRTIYNYIKSILGDYSDWKNSNNRDVKISRLGDNILFGNGSWKNYIDTTRSGYNIQIYWYPKITINGNGLNPDYTVKEIYATCEVSLSVYYSDEYTISYQEGGCAIDYYSSSDGQGGDFQPKTLTFNLSFDMYFQPSDSYKTIDPLDSSTTSQYLEDIKSFIKNCGKFNKSTLTKDRVKINASLYDQNRNPYTMTTFY